MRTYYVLDRESTGGVIFSKADRTWDLDWSSAEEVEAHTREDAAWALVQDGLEERAQSSDSGRADVFVATQPDGSDAAHLLLEVEVAWTHSVDEEKGSKMRHSGSAT